MPRLVVCQTEMGENLGDELVERTMGRSWRRQRLSEAVRCNADLTITVVQPALQGAVLAGDARY